MLETLTLQETEHEVGAARLDHNLGNMKTLDQNKRVFFFGRYPKQFGCPRTSKLTQPEAASRSQLCSNICQVLWKQFVLLRSSVWSDLPVLSSVFSHTQFLGTFKCVCYLFTYFCIFARMKQVLNRVKF